MRKGYAINGLQEAALQDYGLQARNIYLRGRGAETLAELLRSFRGTNGEVVIAADLRIFGSTRKEILAVTDQIESVGLKVIDIRNKDASLSKLIDLALAKTAGDARRNAAGKSVKSAGRKGGKTKAECQELRRAAVAHEDVVKRICAADELSWRRKAEILGPLFSPATLRRHYS